MPFQIKKITDTSLRNRFEDLGKNGISYNEMKKLIKSTYDGKVSSTEQVDLEYILHNAKLEKSAKRLLRTFLDNPKKKPLKAVANLDKARAAVRFTNLKISMKIGAGNDDDNPKQLEANRCILGLRNKYGGNGLSYIRRIARLAEEGGCGNCGEQTAVAFMYLYRNGIRPLDYMGWDNPKGSKEDVSHAFLVVGRREKSTNAFPKSWGGYAVISDPWANDWYYASEYYIRMYFKGKYLPDSLHREP